MNNESAEQHIFRQMHKLIDISRRFLHICYIEPIFKHFELSPGEFEMILRIYNNSSPESGVPMKWLISRLSVNQPAASMLVGSLVNKGYVLRTQDPADRRRSLLNIAPQERIYFDRLAEAQGKATLEVMTGMPVEKQQFLLSFIDEMYSYFFGQGVSELCKTPEKEAPQKAEDSQS